MTVNERGDLVFESGRFLHMAMPQVGIDPEDLSVTCGYDDAPQLEPWEDTDDYPPKTLAQQLTPEERREFSEWVIGLWRRWAVEEQNG
jgi:hypothetical protein